MTWDLSTTHTMNNLTQVVVCIQPTSGGIHMNRFVDKVLNLSVTWNFVTAVRMERCGRLTLAVRTTTQDKMCCNNSKKELSYGVYTYHVATNFTSEEQRFSTEGVQHIYTCCISSCMTYHMQHKYSTQIKLTIQIIHVINSSPTLINRKSAVRHSYN